MCPLFFCQSCCFLPTLKRLFGPTDSYHANAFCSKRYIFCKKIIKNREKLSAALIDLGFTVTPSLANFVFAKSDKITGEELYTELKARGILHLKVLYSEEKPINLSGERSPASISFVPSVAGLLIAGEVIKNLIK